MFLNKALKEINFPLNVKTYREGQSWFYQTVGMGQNRYLKYWIRRKVPCSGIGLCQEQLSILIPYRHGPIPAYSSCRANLCYRLNMPSRLGQTKISAERIPKCLSADQKCERWCFNHIWCILILKEIQASLAVLFFFWMNLERASTAPKQSRIKGMKTLSKT